MAAIAVGQISEFQSELESITVYLERVAQYIRANQIPTESLLESDRETSGGTTQCDWQSDVFVAEEFAASGSTRR